MGEPKKAKLFTHGGSQAVRLPREYRFEGKEVRIRREGAAVILEPVTTDWQAVWRDLDQIAEEAGEEFPDRPDPLSARTPGFDD